MKQKIKALKDKILDLMYPKNIKCMFCTEELNNSEYNCTCENCMPILPFIKNPCEKCGSEMNENQKGVCIKCKKRNYNFSQAKSVFLYEGLPSSVVQGLKYSNKKYLVPHIIRYLLDIYSMWNVFADYVVCVPMFSTKEKQRGYNQSKLMAEEFSREAKIPFLDCLLKTKDTSSQTSLNVNERIENVAESFDVDKRYLTDIKDKIFLIVDDVITTGATSSEISKVLIKNGAKACYVLTFAHTQLQQINLD